MRTVYGYVDEDIIFQFKYFKHLQYHSHRLQMVNLSSSLHTWFVLAIIQGVNFNPVLHTMALVLTAQGHAGITDAKDCGFFVFRESFVPIMHYA